MNQKTDSKAFSAFSLETIRFIHNIQSINPKTAAKELEQIIESAPIEMLMHVYANRREIQFSWDEDYVWRLIEKRLNKSREYHFDRLYHFEEFLEQYFLHDDSERNMKNFLEQKQRIIEEIAKEESIEGLEQMLKILRKTLKTKYNILVLLEIKPFIKLKKDTIISSSTIDLDEQIKNNGFEKEEATDIIITDEEKILPTKATLINEVEKFIEECMHLVFDVNPVTSDYKVLRKDLKKSLEKILDNSFQSKQLTNRIEKFKGNKFYAVDNLVSTLTDEISAIKLNQSVDQAKVGNTEYPGFTQGGTAMTAIVGEAFDPVNRPSHYADGKIEVIDYLKDKLTAEEFKGFLKGNSLKYLSRATKKGTEEQDYQKGQWYLNYLNTHLKEIEDQRKIEIMKSKL